MTHNIRALIRMVFTLFALVPIVQTSTAGDILDEQLMSDDESNFSFLDPDSFRFADEQERSVLEDIFRTEFTLDHLPSVDQELLTEALGKSGVEVQSSCTVHKSTVGHTKAFFRRWEENSKVRYEPAKSDKPASMHVHKAVGSPHVTQSPDPQPIVGDTADYPYPLSEANVVIKVIPVNLSSIVEIERTESEVRFEAYPSRILYAGLREEDRLWDEVAAKVEFGIDLDRQRLNWLELNLQKPVKAYPFIRISEFRLRYEFEDNQVVGRNVVKSVEHHMMGRLALVFRPRFDFLNELSYESCVATPPTESYLSRAMDAMASL